MLGRRGHKIFGIDKRSLENVPFACLQTDLASPTSQQEIKTWLRNHKLSNIDAVVCNAGVFSFKSLLELEESEMSSLWQTNVLGVWRTIKATQPCEKIFVISSEAAILSRTPYTWPYVGTKRALEDFIECLRLEEPNLKISVIRPGAMQTTMLDELARLSSKNAKQNFVWSIAQTAAKFRSSSVVVVAEKIADLIESKNPPEYYNIGHNPVLRLVSLLPNSVTALATRLLLAFI